MFLKNKWLLIFSLFIILVGPTKFILGQTINPDSSLSVILNGLQGTPLTLSEALGYAKTNSTSIGKAEAHYSASMGSLRKERGYFDPELYFQLNYEDVKAPTASFFAGADVLSTQQTTSQSGLKLKLPVGTQLELSLNTVSLSTNSQFAFLNPEYTAFGSLSFRQPLLRGFAATGRQDLTQAELNNDAAKFRYNQEVLTTSTEVESAYWQLYTAERDYGVQKLVRDRAQEFLKEAELREKAGLVGPNQVASAKTFLAEQELLLIDRKEDLGNQSDRLAVLIGVRPEADSLSFKTVDNPPTEFPAVPVDELIDYALSTNMDLQAAQKEIDAAQSLLDAARWEVLPSLDVVGSLISSGIGGDTQDVIFGGDTLRAVSGGSFGNMLNQVFKRNFPGWSVGLELNVPIGFRTGLGEKDRLEAAVFYAKQQYIELSRSLEHSVRSAQRELSNGNSRLKAATDGVEAAQEQVRIGLIEFQNGRITAFELVRLGEDFAIAQRRYSDALVRTVNAVATLRQLTSGRYPENSDF
jgi:outer membrane protein